MTDHDTPTGRAGRPWVLFDLDGTLLDYAAAETMAVTATLQEAGLAVGDELLAHYREVNARMWEALERGTTTVERLRVARWAEVLADRGVDGVDVTALAERFVGHLAAAAPLVEGAEAVLTDVARTHRVAYVTNGLADVQRPRLEATPLGRFAEVVVISDEVGAAKPDPAIFDAAFARMGDPPREVVTMVGDSLSADVAGGAGYLLRTVWIAPPWVPDPGPGQPRPTHRIAALHELPALLRAG